MKWETDNDPMTPEKAIKLKAHSYIMRMKNAGVPWAYVTNAAVVMVLELKGQFLKLNPNMDPTEKKKRLSQFEELEKGIVDYLPKAKPEKETIQ